ncbi:MAG: hypothetical protein KAS72_11560 [Phycisphaerales bacterium]|nr:hypothetical protein [Phycisphaerales bacterium]
MHTEHSSGWWMASAFIVTTLIALVIVVLGAVELVRGEGAALLAAGVVALVGCMAVFAVGLALDTTIQRRLFNIQGRISELTDQLHEHQRILRQLHEHTMLSDSAKAIVYRKEERTLIRRAIDEEISRENWEEARILIDEMVRRFGSGPEIGELRDSVASSQAAAMERQLDAKIAALDRFISEQAWDRAYIQADRIAELFPDSPRASQLITRIEDAKRETRQTLERAFREAADREDTDRAMELLTQLDQYLTEAEAAPLVEIARGVIAKQRDNLGARFKMAVHEHAWSEAVRIGEHITAQFPNSKMAEEVASLLDGLRTRAAEGGEAPDAVPATATTDGGSDHG